MRISDWSSDVCSSDLRGAGLGARLDPEIVGKRAEAIAGAVPRDDAIAGARQRTDLAAPIFLRAERAVKQEDGDPARAGHAVIGEPRHAARSTISAPPMPVAPDTAISPVARSRRSSSSSRVPIRLTPVAPIACPIAIPPQIGRATV